MSEEKLLPCPFCGGEATPQDDGVNSDAERYSVTCWGCSVVILFTTRCATPEGAAKVWNTRAESAARAAGREEGIREGRNIALAALGEAHRDIGEWLQLGRRQREELGPNRPLSPTDAGMAQSEAVRRKIVEAESLLLPAERKEGSSGK